MEKIVAGIIGTGFIGRAHVEAVRRLGFVELRAVAEVDQATAEAAAEKLQIPKAYGDYRSLLDDPEIQVVHNCTPNYLHYEINRAILASGKHVISEKPLTITRAEAEELTAYAADTGLVNAICFNYRYFPLVQEARARVASGYIGRINLVYGGYLQDWLLYPTDYNWRVESQLGGATRAIGDIGVHWCDLVEYITGLRITEVMADFYTAHPIREPSTGEWSGQRKRVQTEDYASVLLGFDRGSRGVFTVSQISPGRKNKLFFELDGTQGALAWDQERPNELWIGHRDRASEILLKDPSLLSETAKPYAAYPGGHNEGWPDGLKNLLVNVYKYIKMGKRPGVEEPDFPTFADGARAMALAEAIKRSAENRSWIAI